MRGFKVFSELCRSHVTSLLYYLQSTELWDSGAEYIIIMPRNLGELGEMFSKKEVEELRQDDQAKIKKLKVDKKMLEEKISRLTRLSKPFLAEFFPNQIPAGYNSPHWSCS